MRTHYRGIIDNIYEIATPKETFQKTVWIYKFTSNDTMISENIFKCEVCDYNTKYKSDFVKHIRTHTKRPYVCSECEYSAASIYYIYYFIS